MAEWDPRLITRARALELAGSLPVYVTREFADLAQYEPEGGGPAQESRWQINLRCRADDQSVAMLATDKRAYDVTVEELLAGVLRHMVIAHGTVLSGAPQEQEAGSGH